MSHQIMKCKCGQEHVIPESDPMIINDTPMSKTSLTIMWIGITLCVFSMASCTEFCFGKFIDGAIKEQQVRKDAK